ncbi:LytR/AlgR family response regulator transcription factor [Kaarinaea lacus]
MTTVSAIIADDEDTLRSYLIQELKKAWPELLISGEASNGIEALSLIKEEQPDVAFLDIKMPGLTGLNVANFIDKSTLVVFITAYNDYAVKAFELDALDYLLKPLDSERLAKTVARLKDKISNDSATPQDWAAIVQKINGAASTGSNPNYIRWIKASHQDNVHIIPVDDVRYFKADNKYTTVVTDNKEWLIRKPVKELETELDPDLFWRVHRGIIVNVSYIACATRTLNGRYKLQLLDVNEPILVSRAYSHLFKQM